MPAKKTASKLSTSSKLKLLYSAASHPVFELLLSNFQVDHTLPKKFLTVLISTAPKEITK